MGEQTQHTYAEHHDKSVADKIDATKDAGGVAVAGKKCSATATRFRHVLCCCALLLSLFWSHTHTGIVTREDTNAHVVPASEDAQVHQCMCQENVRKTMAFLGQCLATMGKILRAPSGDSSLESYGASVGSVRLLWECELQRRSISSSLHPADL